MPTRAPALSADRAQPGRTSRRGQPRHPLGGQGRVGRAAPARRRASSTRGSRGRPRPATTRRTRPRGARGRRPRARVHGSAVRPFADGDAQELVVGGMEVHLVDPLPGRVCVRSTGGTGRPVGPRRSSARTGRPGSGSTRSTTTPHTTAAAHAVAQRPHRRAVDPAARPGAHAAPRGRVRRLEPGRGRPRLPGVDDVCGGAGPAPRPRPRRAVGSAARLPRLRPGAASRRGQGGRCRGHGHDREAGRLRRARQHHPGRAGRRRPGARRRPTGSPATSGSARRR